MTKQRAASRVAFGAALLAVLLCGAGCRPRKQTPLETKPEELAYPACSGAPAAPVVVASRALRGTSESMSEGETVERFRIERRGCLIAVALRQEWALGATDAELLLDEELRPLRAWKRMTVPSSTRADGNADIRSYELRQDPVVVKRRSMDGAITFARVNGKGKPTVVIGPGRGFLSAWIRRANLPVGGKTREWALDFREMTEVVREVTLKREPDAEPAGLGRKVRVYTVYGREAIYADEDNIVLGDLAGLRPAELVKTPEPSPHPMFGEPDSHSP